MYKEVSKSNVNKLLVLLGFIISMVVVMLVTNNIIYPVNKMLADVINILYFGFGVYFYMRYFMTSYEYKVEDNTFVITKLLNKNNPQIVLSISIDDIEKIEEYPDDFIQDAEKLDFSSFNNQKKYYFYAYFDNKKYVVLFNPTDKLLEFINEVKS
ncbi:MAG: hypothetical protein E7404_04945 [Ruminococcaceae bacterium]|nr:hypothetical protein [Oscillospiraceae bacterium]